MEMMDLQGQKVTLVHLECLDSVVVEGSHTLDGAAHLAALELSLSTLERLDQVLPML